MSHYEEQREQDYAERLSKSNLMKVIGGDLERDELEAFEGVNLGNSQLKKIRSRFSKKFIIMLRSREV